jgi:hypothetical protein
MSESSRRAEPQPQASRKRPGPHAESGKSAAYRRGIVSSTGDPWPDDAECYVCPFGDYIWYRPHVGTPIPVCPTHNVPLRRKGS